MNDSAYFALSLVHAEVSSQEPTVGVNVDLIPFEDGKFAPILPNKALHPTVYRPEVHGVVTI